MTVAWPLLRNKMRERGFIQTEVQDALGWGRSYLSQLLTKQEALRFEQVLMILSVIGDTPEAFFYELYPSARQTHHSPLESVARGLVGLLKLKGMLTTPELAHSVEMAKREP